MVNKKTVSGPKGTTNSAPKGTTRKTASRRVVDPMMVSAVRAKSTTSKNVASKTSQKAASGHAIYNIDDLYDKDGNLIIDEADEVLNERVRKTAPRSKTTTRSMKRAVDEEDDFDFSDEELLGDVTKKKVSNLGAEKKAAKRRKKAEKKAKRKTPIWAKILISFLTILIILIGIAAYYFVNIYSAASGALEGNPMDAFLNKKPMEKDEYGRTNILIFGTAEDDEGHGGAMLTDSILVVSMDQERKIASTFSVPRDLWVNYTVAGEDTLMCSVGYKGKINATYYCSLGDDENGDRDKAARYFAKKITEVTDVQIQYYVAVDFRVLRDVVNTLGGIDVDVHSTDERGIYDICMHGIKLDQGMNYNLNGDQVLDLARARNAKGGYGLANSNFDREINQQRIINGIRAKALNVGVLADVHKAKSLLEAFGENVKTNFTWAEIGTAMDVISGLHGEVESIETQSLYGTGNIGGQSVVVPSGANINVDSTLYNYNKIHLYLRDRLDEASEKYDDSLKSSENDSGVETESKSEE